jgi:hypothetical protein
MEMDAVQTAATTSMIMTVQPTVEMESWNQERIVTVAQLLIDVVQL